MGCNRAPIGSAVASGEAGSTVAKLALHRLVNWMFDTLALIIEKVVERNRQWPSRNQR